MIADGSVAICLIGKFLCFLVSDRVYQLVALTVDQHAEAVEGRLRACSESLRTCLARFLWKLAYLPAIFCQKSKRNECFAS